MATPTQTPAAPKKPKPAPLLRNRRGDIRDDQPITEYAFRKALRPVQHKVTSYYYASDDAPLVQREVQRRSSARGAAKAVADLRDAIRAYAIARARLHQFGLDISDVDDGKDSPVTLEKKVRRRLADVVREKREVLRQEYLALLQRFPEGRKVTYGETRALVRKLLAK